MDIHLIETKLSRRPHSTLFARLASEYLAIDKLEEAKELCNSGLQKYPNYATAHLVKAQCYAKDGDYKTALVHLQFALNVFPDSTKLQKLYNDFKEQLVQKAVEADLTLSPNIEKPEIQNLSELKKVAEQTETVVSEQPTVETIIPSVNEIAVAKDINQAATENSKVEVIEEPILPENIQNISVESQPAIITEESEQVQNANFQPVSEIAFETTKSFTDDRIVSKTLAEIYVMQGEYEEAIMTYKLLMRNRPVQSNEFEKRIKELEIELQKKKSN